MSQTKQVNPLYMTHGGLIEYKAIITKVGMSELNSDKMALAIKLYDEKKHLYP